MFPEMHFRHLPIRPHHLGIGSGVLLALLSACAGAASAYGFNQLTGLSFLTGLLLVLLLRATSMYFLRYQSAYERFINSGWDRNLAYVLTTLFSITLAAFGLYCLSVYRAAQTASAPMPVAAGQTVQSLIVTANTDVPRTAVALAASEAQEAVSALLLSKFLNDTFVEQTTIALGCWIVPVALELFILLLVLYHRPRYLPYHFM